VYVVNDTPINIPARKACCKLCQNCCSDLILRLYDAVVSIVSICYSYYSSLVLITEGLEPSDVQNTYLSSWYIGTLVPDIAMYYAIITLIHVSYRESYREW
jgi:hypothetical protein